jgi:aconitate hydratase 2/2-methylisocitrate dehydratase
MNLIDEYKQHIKQRDELGVPPLALNVEQTIKLIKLLSETTIKSEANFLLNLFENKINAGVDDSAHIKANFLNDILKDKKNSPLINKQKAIKILGTMLGGYNIPVLIDVLKDKKSSDELKTLSALQLENTLLIYDYFNDIKSLNDLGNKFANNILHSWAKANWFLNKKEVAKEITLCVYKVDGETNTDDLSPASYAFSRADIPLHANAFLINRDKKPLDKLKELKAKGHSLVYVGDVVGTGSSRKSAINTVQWHMGEEIPYIPNKHTKGVVIGASIAPIFYNTAQDSGCLPIQVDVSDINMGDIITIKPYDGVILKEGKEIANFKIDSLTLFDEMRAGGRIPLMIGKALSKKASETLGLKQCDIFKKAKQTNKQTSYTLAQKMVGKACGLKDGVGINAGEYCEPLVTTVGSQDTTGPMTRDEIKELAALNFGADMVMQSFCHTAAYPKPSDIELQHTLPPFWTSRKGVILKAGDGVIHSWLNRLCLPDTVGTGGDSHTRFPIGISFPAGSGLVAFASVSSIMPLSMPKSVLVKFSGKMQEGITLRDLVNAIPHQAIKEGLLTVPKKNKKNIFAGNILEIQGLEDLKCEQAFELSDASAERSASACVINLNKEPIIEYLNSNIKLIEELIKQGYEDKNTLQRRANKMKEWIKNPVLLRADSDAKYEAIIEINLNNIDEPILACPNDPDDVKTLSEIHNQKMHTKIDEVFVGSCMTNIGLFRALGKVLEGEGQVPTRLWIAPPTKMDERTLKEDGYYSIFGASGARLELPGCSLCMGNQAQVAKNSYAFSTSTRNFDNRLGMGAQVYLGSAELAGVVAIKGAIPTKDEYLRIIKDKIKLQDKKDIYKYLNFDRVGAENLSNLVK